MRSSTRSDRGQSTVELALGLPLVCLVLLGVVQVGLVVRDQMLVHHAAREAARAASVSASPAGAAAAAVARTGIDGARVTTTSSGGAVTVTVTITNHTDVPLIGALVPDAVLRATVSMAREPP